MKNLIFIVLLFLNVNLFSQDINILDINEISANITLSNPKEEKVVLVLRDNNNIIKEIKYKEVNINEKVNNSTHNIVIIKTEKTIEKINYKKLQPNTKYYIDVYNDDDFEKSYEFYTLAVEPKNNVKNIGLSNPNETTFNLNFLNGDGEGRIVLISKDESKIMCLDGVGNNQFSNNNVLMYDVKNNENSVSNIELNQIIPDTKYYIYVYEYNGENSSRNYLDKVIKNQNYIEFEPIPQRPEIINKEFRGSNQYFVEWKKNNSIRTYKVEISNNEQFSEIISSYSIGKQNKFNINTDNFKKGIKYYGRIKSLGNNSMSNTSEIFEIMVK